MSEFTNRAAYLRGLADGMKLDTETNEGRLISELLDFVGDLAAEIEAIDDEQGFIADQIDELEEEVELIGDEVFGDYDEYEEYDEDDEFELTCESCGAELIVTGEELIEEDLACPVCGEPIEIEIECDCDCDDDCDCDCE